jgi:hypothetical protein
MTPRICSVLTLAWVLAAGTAQAADSPAQTDDSASKLAAAAAAEYERLQEPAPTLEKESPAANDDSTPQPANVTRNRSINLLRARLAAAERRRVRDHYREQRLALVAKNAAPKLAESGGAIGGK